MYRYRATIVETTFADRIVNFSNYVGMGVSPNSRNNIHIIM